PRARRSPVAALLRRVLTWAPRSHRETTAAGSRSEASSDPVRRPRPKARPDPPALHGVAGRKTVRRAATGRANSAGGLAGARRLRLANGLTVLLRPLRDQPVVSVWCWYRVGSRDERPGLTGISHWVEHMNFKGTRRVPKNEVTRQVELAGGFWNGYTWL